MGGKILHAPASSPSSILDVGSGTGAAASAFAQQFPSAQVTGIDTQAVPDLHPKPSNLNYTTGSILDASGSYDVVFSRLMIAGITGWPGYVEKVKGLLNPGGYAEFQELYLQMIDANGNEVANDGPAQEIFATTEKMGLDFKAGPKIKGWLEAAGYKNVTQVVYEFPLGSKGKNPEFGKWFLENIKETFPVSAKQILGDFTPEMAAIQEKKMALAEAEGWHMKYYVTYGQK